MLSEEGKCNGPRIISNCIKADKENCIMCKEGYILREAKNIADGGLETTDTKCVKNENPIENCKHYK